MNKKQIYLIVGILLVLCVGCTRKSDMVMEQDILQELEIETSTPDQGTEEIEISTQSVSLQEEVNTDVYVHVCGAVQKPGVYKMESGDRIYQAIEIAGGFAVNAQESYINQSKQLEDGMKIWIPTFQEIQDNNLEVVQNEEETSSGEVKINLNTASESELCTLPGVGASKAKTIIAYREKNGKFQKIEDIMKIEGIKEGSFEKLKSQITVQ